MKRILVFGWMLGAAACGAFLADTGDDETNDVPPVGDGGVGDGATTSEGASNVDGSSSAVDAGPDAASSVGATCGAAKCKPEDRCCVSSAGGACVIGDAPCFGSELRCTRRLDCAAGHVCCITATAIAAGISSSQCVSGDTCAGGSDVMCSTSDSPSETGCGVATCKAGERAATVYGLPDAAPWAICQ